jgi:Uma2 family endonuclease
MTSIDHASRTSTADLPLRSGERLTRQEFEQRYAALPHLKKAELLEGVVVVPSPVRNPHAAAHARLVAWLTPYWIATPGTHLLIEPSVRMGEHSMPQPDAVLRIAEQAGGRSRISADAYLEGAPELIAEIALSSADYDMHAKRDLYRRSGVQEYLVWLVEAGELHWLCLQAGNELRMRPDAHGSIASQVFPGLRLPVAALLADDMRSVMAAVQQGVATPAHAALVARLQAAQHHEGSSTDA